MHGLSTLNRLLGKKNKEASRSTTNLSKSTSNLDTSSQHNKISPIANNAPFEQTFRVTVYLPKKQLYVERIGAKTKLATLMDKICENKHLTPDKYEFRHPGDMSQTFDTNKTIGEVGLNELQLVLKTESRFSSDFRRFHADDVMKYKSSVPDSVSSSEISRNYGKNMMQKASPYSSTTSLNSLDSTGMNLTAKMQPPVAPARKKRAAPRPPSQNSIPEQEIFGTTLNVFKEPHSILPRKNFHVSSPQLNNNIINNGQLEARSDKNNNVETGNRLNAITRPTSLYVSSTTEIEENGNAGRQRSPSESSEVQQILHERQNSNSLEKKKKPAPVPPKRVHRPVPSPRTVQEDLKATTITEIKEIDELEIQPRLDDKVADHVTFGNVSKTMLNSLPSPDELPSVESSDGPISIQITSSDSSIEHVVKDELPVSSPKLPAVSKVHIKHEEERRSSSEDEMTVNIYNVTKSVVTQSPITVIKETSPIPVVNASNQVTVVEEQRKVAVVKETSPIAVVKSQNHVTVIKEQSQVTIVKEQRQVTVVKEPVREVTKEVEVKPVVKAVEVKQVVKPIDVEPEVRTVKEVVKEMKEEVRPPSPLWTYTLPAPPVFADSSVVDHVSPTDHQKTGGKFYSEFTSTDCNETIMSDSNTTVISAETQIHPIIVDRSPRDESFIISSKEYTQPIADNGSDNSTEIITSDLEDGYLGNGKNVKVESPTTPTPVVSAKRVEKEIIVEDFQRSRLLISRSDSFHSIGQARNFDAKRSPFSPAQRSTSFLSLVQTQKAEQMTHRPSSDSSPYSRQKSTSELSISDVPSLQSLEVLKNILNSSRKNSLQDAAPKEEKSVAVNHQEVIAELVKRKEEVAKPPEPKVERPVAKPVVEVKPAETQWRYSGPPKINLSTWSERPKVDVAIAADSDYKFGGVTATLPRDFKKNQEAASKRHTIHISNNERVVKEEIVKYTKPKVLGVEYKKDVSPIAVNPVVVSPTVVSPVIQRDSSSEIFNKPSRTIINIKPRPMSMDMSNAYSTIVTSTAPSSVSYNRLNSNAKKFTPVVHGFKLNNIKEGDHSEVTTIAVVKKKAETSEKKFSEPPSVPAKPSFIRSTSAGDINRNMKFTAAETRIEDEVDSPFSQFGLRKTGLKEKILLHDKNTKSMFGKVVDVKHEPVLRYNHENHIARSLSHPVPPKPPTAPPPMNFRKSAPVELGTRNQLLDAIANFNKDSLRHK